MKNSTILKLLTASAMAASLSAAVLTDRAGNAVINNPLSADVRGLSSGGILNDIDAYTDGAGVSVIGSTSVSGGSVDNSAQSKLILKYGEKAKADAISVSAKVLASDASAEEKILATKMAGDAISIIGGFADGTSCDDENEMTSLDQYTNNVCSGTFIDGTPCDDGDISTSDDSYTNGICTGVIIPTAPEGLIIEGVSPNGLTYTSCGIGFTNAQSKAACESAGMRLPKNGEIQTTGLRDDVYGTPDGVPACPTGWTNMDHWVPSVWYVYSSGRISMGNSSYNFRCVK